MNKVTPLIFLSLSTVSLTSGDVLTASIETLGDPTGLTLSDGLSFRFAELAGAAGETNTSTHILLEGLTQFDGTVYQSSYSAVDTDSGGTVQDAGIVLMDIPNMAPLPEGTVASPIVGVIQRAGSWDNYNVQLPSSTVGQSSGTGDYGDGSISFALSRNNENFSGTAGYTVVDENTLTLSPFSLIKDGVASYTFDETTLEWNGSAFVGTLISTDEAPGFDSLIFAFNLSDVPDADMDLVPDITDPSIDSSVTWGLDWPVNEVFDVNTGDDNYGWLNVREKPFVYSYSLGRYIFLPEEIIASFGSWFFVFKITDFPSDQSGWAGRWVADEAGTANTGDFLGFIDVDEAPFIWLYSWSRYAFLPEEIITNNGSWVFLPFLGN